MSIEKADIIRSLAGRDEGGLFFVLEIDGEYALLADGRGRKLENPKRKKLRHLCLDGVTDCRAAEKIRAGERITNSELRRALAEYRAALAKEEGGM